jgi:hypothetical protein
VVIAVGEMKEVVKLLPLVGVMLRGGEMGMVRTMPEKIMPEVVEGEREEVNRMRIRAKKKVTRKKVMRKAVGVRRVTMRANSLTNLMAETRENGGKSLEEESSPQVVSRISREKNPRPEIMLSREGGNAVLPNRTNNLILLMMTVKPAVITPIARELLLKISGEIRAGGGEDKL